MVVDRVRKQRRAERAPGGCEIGRDNEKGGCEPMKRGRKAKVSNSKHNDGDAVVEEKEFEERKENGVSQKEANMVNDNFVSEIGEHCGVKANKTGVRGRKNGNPKKITDSVYEKEKENKEDIEHKECGVTKGERKVKFDENCEVMGEDTKGVSKNIMWSDELTSSSRKRKKVNYNEDEVDEEDEDVFRKKRKKKRGGPKAMQKRKILTAEKAPENHASDKEENGVNTKKRGRKFKKSGKPNESEGLKSEGGDKGEVNKVRRSGPKKQGNIVKEESTRDLGHVEQEKDSSQSNDGCRYSLRTSKNKKEQKQECVSRGEKKKMHDKVRNFSY